MDIIVIAAVGENRELGRSGGLCWHIPGDMQAFRAATTGHTVIMGRRTFESMGSKPLPKRNNIVVGSAPYVSSLDEAIATATHASESKVFVIGGVRLYEEAINSGVATHMILSHIHATCDNADVWFPVVDWSAWKVVSRVDHEVTDEHPAWSHVTYVRANSGETHTRL